MTRAVWIVAMVTVATACGAHEIHERSEPPAPAPSGAPVDGVAPSTVKITSLTTSAVLVEYGMTATLSWTLEGKPDELFLDGVSVLGESSHVVSPARRQTFRLVARAGAAHDEKVVEVAARGIDLLFGVAAAPGILDGPNADASFYSP